MSEPSSARIKNVFGEALERRGAEREAYLVEVCAEDADLRRRVENLLIAAEKDDVFLGEATMGPVRPAVREPHGEEPGDRIGPFKILQLIGEGGFGSVYMAEQERPVRRRVALKIIKLGMDTRGVVARFEQERQALALMDHPNIAKVFDAGATQTGRPYFVMELVKGDPITAFCDKNILRIEERLELFTQVCQAVQHAHTKGIIHRDIKPNNVLVGMQDGRPLARVIDFGIAKATEHRLTEKTLFTELRQLIGTPEYMSPEQAEGGLDIDTRTDVYSLGVLLYELLTGSTPFDGKRLRSAAFAELQRIIREDDPPSPSTRLSKSADTLPMVAAQRRIEPRRLGTMVRGELDWIVMRALDKDRSRRYDTASSLGADVQRYLAGEAVLAAPVSTLYRMKKFVRRNGTAVAAGSAVMLALAGGLGVATAGYITAVRARNAETQARLAETNQREMAQRSQTDAEHHAEIARQQTERAEKEIVKTRAVDDFLQKLLGGAAPSEARANRDVTVRELVDRSARGIDAGELKGQPETAAAVLGTIGGLYWDLGEKDKARRYLEQAIGLGESGSLSKSEQAILRDKLGHVLRDSNDLDGAERMYRRALADAMEGGNAPWQAVGSIYNSLAGIAMARNNLDEARDLYARSLDVITKGAGENSREALYANLNMGTLANRRGDPREAERLFRLVLDRARAALPADDPLIVDACTNLGVAVGGRGGFDESLALLQEALGVAGRIYGDAHPTTLHVLTQIGSLRLVSGNWPEAEKAYNRVIESTHALPESQRIDLFEPLRGYASVIEYQGRPAEAEAARREMLAIARAGRTPAEVATCEANLGNNLLAQRKWVEAEPVLRGCLSSRLTILQGNAPQEWLLDSTRSMLGEAVLGQAEQSAASDPAGSAARFVEAEALILPGAQSLPGNTRVNAGPPGSPDRRRQPLERACRLYTAWQGIKPDPALAQKAVDWQRRLADYDAARQSSNPR